MPVNDFPTAYDTLTVREEGRVLFAGIRNPPMNLLGSELVRDVVSLIQRGEADHGSQVLVFKSEDPDYFIPHVDLTQIEEGPGRGHEVGRRAVNRTLVSPPER